ncbi:MAG TPA: hypothetical protein VK596_03980, partial [Edaphobacter sp.]|nr:hypothetical protein [Edaphobacter sp.]
SVSFLIAVSTLEDDPDPGGGYAILAAKHGIASLPSRRHLKKSERHGPQQDLRASGQSGCSVAALWGI